jgi:plasmid stability protein
MKHTDRMSLRMVQIRNVPAEFHRRLKARAAMEGMSMSDYILREVGKALDRPTRDEVLSRLRARPVRSLQTSPADVIRSERDTP